MVGIHNKLPDKVVETNTITIFKKYLDRYTNRKGLKEYTPNTDRWD